MRKTLLKSFFLMNLAVLALLLSTTCILFRQQAMAVPDTPQYCCYDQGGPNDCSGCVSNGAPPWIILPDTTLRKCRGNGNLDYACREVGNVVCFSGVGVTFPQYSANLCSVPNGLVTVLGQYRVDQCSPTSTDCGNSGG
jgi:hypothetical protein